MRPSHTPFLPVSADIDDEALESLARDKGVGALVKPERAQRVAIEPPGLRPSEAVASPGVAAPTPRHRMKPINIELPDYAWTELKIRAARAQVSVRHIIMTALKQQGIPIADIDLVEDGRRLR